MQSLNNYKNITTAATTVFAPTGGLLRTVLGAININKTLTGTITIKSGSTTIGVIAATTPAGEYWYSNTGTLIEDLQIVNGSTEDVTVFYRNI